MTFLSNENAKQPSGISVSLVRDRSHIDTNIFEMGHVCVCVCVCVWSRFCLYLLLFFTVFSDCFITEV